MEDDLNLLATGRQSPFLQMEDNHNFLNGRRPQLKVKLAKLALASTELGTACCNYIAAYLKAGLQLSP
jgi:hypothetical protein